jgi:hypothetical protein
MVFLEFQYFLSFTQYALQQKEQYRVLTINVFHIEKMKSTPELVILE